MVQLRHFSSTIDSNVPWLSPDTDVLQHYVSANFGYSSILALSSLREAGINYGVRVVLFFRKRGTTE